MPATFRPCHRIRRRAEFQRVYEKGRRVNGRFMTLFTLSNTLGVPRLGIAATRKLGGSVQRSRAKRMVREVFRRNRPGSGLDVVIVPRRELLDAGLADLEADYQSLLGRRPSRGR